tara:strand:- start:3197 stop:3547 length:351 start_codon:yes stop_codon:yes gene_type:complete
LIDKNGANMIVTARAATPERESGKPWRGSTGTETVTVKAVQYDYEMEEVKDAAWRNSRTRFLVSENDTTGNSQFTTVDLTTATDLEDTSGNVWSIYYVELTEPGNDRVVYTLYAAR